MLSADYWIAKNLNANDVLLTEVEIDIFNQSLIENIPAHMTDIYTTAAQINAEKLYVLVNRYDVLSQQELFINGEGANDLVWAELFALKNSGSILETTNVRYALATERCNVRAFPTNVFACRELTDYPLIDRFQETHLEPGQPVLVYHESADGLWFFVRLFNYCGWVEKNKIALFDAAVWRDYCHHYQKECLVVTGKRLYIAEGYCSGRQKLLFSMGAQLPLWYGAPKEIVDMQNICGSYVVAVPRRHTDGSGLIVPLLIPIGSDVAVGRLPYTLANLLRQAFKLLGERYGWGGLYESWDCSGLIMAAYSVFGFRLPRNCAVEEQPKALKRRLDFSENDDIINRSQMLAAVNSGGVVFTPGHVMMYLGATCGKHYVIHSTSGGRDSRGNILNCVLVANMHEHSTSKQLRLIDQVYAAGNFQ
jgi:hypothetical protein